MSLTAGDVTVEEGVAFYAYRGKGGKRGRRELPAPAFQALVASLADVGLTLSAMDPTASLWHAGAAGTRLSSATCYARFRRYLVAAELPRTGLHVFATRQRSSEGTPASRSRPLARSSISSLGVTTTYLRRLEGQTDAAWQDVAAAIGV